MPEPSRPPKPAERVFHVELADMEHRNAPALKTGAGKAKRARTESRHLPAKYGMTDTRPRPIPSFTKPVSIAAPVQQTSETVMPAPVTTAGRDAPAMTARSADAGTGSGATRSDNHAGRESGGHGAVGASNPENPDASYSKVIRALIEAHKEYPLAARRMGIRGSVTVSFTLDRNGEIKRILLLKSSGHPLLDHAGMKAVRDVEKFPPPYLHLSGEEFSFTIPITFSLISG